MSDLWDKIKPIIKLVAIIAGIIYFWQNGFIGQVYDSIMRMAGS